jgi:cytochrome c553
MTIPVLNKMLKISLLLSALFSNQLMAADIQAGKQIVMSGNNKGATACQSCHGANGAGMAAANFPRLAGLNAGYMTKQLHDFANGARINPIMQPIARALSDKEAENVSAYYAAQKAPVTAMKVDEGVLKEGKRLVELGDWDKTIPACVKCHGPGARGVGKDFPALAGQHASYIEAQLNAWKKGTRKGDPEQLMKGIADRLSMDQIKAVADYLASMNPTAD